MIAPLLELDGVTGGYGDIRILWGVGLSVAPGEIVCLIGSNGAGKTTLLKAISGLVRVTSGTIRFEGRDLSAATPRDFVRAGIIHVPEGRRLFAGMSVRDNLLLGAFQRRDGRAAIRRDLDRVAALFPVLAERWHQDATTLSGGEQQMCAIGRGLMAAPKLLMIDELSLGLAPTMVDKLVSALRQIRESGVTLLVVEQDVSVALSFADRGFVLDRGRVVLAASTAALSHDPRIRTAYLGVDEAA